MKKIIVTVNLENKTQFRLLKNNVTLRKSIYLGRIENNFHVIIWNLIEICIIPS